MEIKLRSDNLTKLKDGRWNFKYECPKTRKIRTIRSKSKAKAVARYKEITKEQILMSDNPSIGATPFKTIIELFIADRRDDVRNGHLREATMASYEIHLQRLLPYRLDQIKENNGIYSFRYFSIETKKTCCIKSDRLDKVECLHRDIKQKHAKSDELLESKVSALNQPLNELKWQFIKQLLGSLKVSPRTKMHHFVTYTTLIHWAIKHNYLASWQRDLISNARPAKPGKTRINIPTEDAVRALIENSDDFWKPFWMIAATTGARLSELRALEWRNVHLNEGRIYIEQSAQRNGIIGPPKTQASYRELPIGSEIVRLLSRFSRTSNLVWPCPEFAPSFNVANQHGTSTRIKRRRLRGPNENKPMSTEDVYRLGMKDVILKNEIQWEGRIHSLRHFPASRMIDKNWNIKRIQTRLGHASAKTTLDVYGHLIERQHFFDEGESLAEKLF